MGHIQHIAERIRQEPARWNSGTEGSVTIDSGPSPDDVFVAATGGTVYQLHKQTFPALDMETGDDIHVVNDSVDPYKTIMNLNSELTDASGGSLSTKYFSFVVWGVINRSGEMSHLMLNLPTGSYLTSGAAIADADNKSVYDIPAIFNGVGFLIARFTFHHLPAGSGTWTLESTQDLRGFTPNTAAGGGGSGGGGGATTLLALTDGPNSYAGEALKIMRVAAGETAFEFVDLDATLVNVDTSSFDGALTVAEDTSQKCFDKLDDVVGLLVPPQPDAFPSGALSVSSTGNSPKVADGAVPDNTIGGSLGSAGDSVTRQTSSTISSNTIQDSGPGNSGTVTAIVNNSSDGARIMTTGNDDGTYTSLIISDNVDFPSETPGFWMSFDARVNKTGMSTGWNRFKITHSGAGDTSDVYFIRDDLTSSPTVVSGVVTQNALGTVDYSSSIAHYNTSAVLDLASMTMTNISGETYYDGSDVFQITSTNSIFSTDNHTLSDIGISTPVTRQTTGAQALDTQTISIDGSNVHNIGKVRYRGKNVSGTGSIVTVNSPQILVMRGSAGSRIDENEITVSGLGSSPVSTDAGRIDMGDGDTPNESFTGTSTDWDSSAALDLWDAAVVGGLLTHDVVDYSSDYLPVGADLSGQNADQYVTFWFRRTPVSKFDIQITGEITGCWIKLPGVSDSVSSENGWWDMTVSYAGSGLPGDLPGGNGSNGVALGGTIPTGSSISNQRFTCTFGTGSSSGATNNNILIRFKVTSGDDISALTFREASN
jgi:hypothetical protein